MAQASSLTREEVHSVYQRWAKVYDLMVCFYYLVGMPIGHWRRLAVDALALRPGDTVVEIGCGASGADDPPNQRLSIDPAQCRITDPVIELMSVIPPT